MNAKAVDKSKCFNQKGSEVSHITNSSCESSYKPRSREEIEQIVKDIRIKYNVNHEYPIQVVKLANKIGFRVYTAEFNDPNIYGAISMENDQKVIYVNIKDNLMTQRYIVAHELAHYFLHMKSQTENKINQIIDMYYSIEYNDHEAEADIFAEELLMAPEAITEKYHNLSKSKEFKLNKKTYSKEIYKQSLLLKLSQYFGVGTKKIGSRLASLGLLENA